MLFQQQLKRILKPDRVRLRGLTAGDEFLLAGTAQNLRANGKAPPDAGAWYSGRRRQNHLSTAIPRITGIPLSTFSK
jgi:hypothetical protein